MPLLTCSWRCVWNEMERWMDGGCRQRASGRSAVLRRRTTQLQAGIEPAVCDTTQHAQAIARGVGTGVKGAGKDRGGGRRRRFRSSWSLVVVFVLWGPKCLYLVVAVAAPLDLRGKCAAGEMRRETRHGLAASSKQVRAAVILARLARRQPQQYWLAGT
jgi:hypothetical protein